MYVYTHREKAKQSSLVVNTSIIITITLSLLFSQLKRTIKDKVFGGEGGRGGGQDANLLKVIFILYKTNLLYNLQVTHEISGKSI